MMKNKKILEILKKNKINSFLLYIPLLTACNNDSKKIIGLLGNATSEGLEKFLKLSPKINNTDYPINNSNPETKRGDGNEGLTVEVNVNESSSPDISGYPLLFIKFNDVGKIDFSNISDVELLSIQNSDAPLDILNLRNDLEKILVSETQNGDWNIAYKPDSSAKLDLSWTNNTGTNVEITSFTINEVEEFLFKIMGNENIIIPKFNLDVNDTKIIQIENHNDGDIVICADENLTGTTPLNKIFLKTLDEGDIILGTPGTSGLTDVPNVKSVELIASKNGDISLGNLGTNIGFNKISSFLLSSEGGVINVGTIKAKQIENFLASGVEFSSISIGNIDIDEVISNFILGGDAQIEIGKFSGNGIVNLNALNMTKNGINLDFTDLKGSVDIITTNQVDVITLSTSNNMDIIDLGGTNVNLIDNTANTHVSIESDKIINFDASLDKIILGSVVATESNFLSETNATNFADALTKSNLAMAAGQSYYFSYNVANASEGFSLLFHDMDDDGSSDIVLSLAGINTDIITHENLGTL